MSQRNASFADHDALSSSTSTVPYHLPQSFVVPSSILTEQIPSTLLASPLEALISRTAVANHLVWIVNSLQVE